MRRAQVQWSCCAVALFVYAASPQEMAANIRAGLQPASTRKPAPEFQLRDGSGKEVSLSDFRGKVVLLNFWATDCGGCRLELPSFVELDWSYKASGLAVIGVSMDILYEDLKNAQEAWSRVKPFIQTHQLKYSILMQNEAVTKAYNIEALPLTHLIDAQGRIAATYVGVVDNSDIEANIKVLLKER